MKTIRERFVDAYDYINETANPTDLTEVMDFDKNEITLSIAAGEGINVNESHRETSKSIGFISVRRLMSDANEINGRITDRVELYLHRGDRVQAYFTGKAVIYHMFDSGINHGYPETDFEVPEQSRQLALNSAMTAVEQAIDALKKSNY